MEPHSGTLQEQPWRNVSLLAFGLLFSVMLLTLMSLAVFASTGHVDWRAGLALGLGNVLGAIVGVRVAVVKGHKWLEHIVTVTLIVFAILPWITE